jgi:hypothetical protein
MIGCADPTYLPPSFGGGSNQQQEVGSCLLQFKNSSICIDWKWEKMPTESEMGTFYFKTYRKNIVDGSAVLVDQSSVPQVVLWMPSMNHGSSPVFTSQEDTGTYRAKNVFFIMPGEWEIKFQIKEGNQVVDEAIATLTI